MPSLITSGSFQPVHLAGLFLGPQMVGEALKGGRLIGRVMDQEGYRVHTPSGAPACPSFVTAVELGSRDRMIAFCKAVQRASPVGSYIEPTPGKASFTPASVLTALLHLAFWVTMGSHAQHHSVQNSTRTCSATGGGAGEGPAELCA